MPSALGRLNRHSTVEAGIENFSGRRLGFPAPLPRFPADFSRYPDIESGEWSKIEPLIRQILHAHAVDSTFVCWRNVKSAYDTVARRSIIISATPHGDASRWFNALLSIRNNLANTAFAAFSVEIIDTKFPTELYTFALRSPDPVAAVWSEVYEKAKAVLKEFGVEWSSLAIFRRGWSPREEDSYPYLSITTPNKNPPLDRVIPVLEEALSSMGVRLDEAEITVQESIF